MSNEKCQQCGAEFSRYVPDIFITLFGCGAGVYDDGHKSHSFRCYERQIAAKDAEIDRLEFDADIGRQLTIWLRKGATITGSPTCLTKGINGDIKGVLIINYPEGEVK